VQDLKNGLFYVNVHSSNFPAGEIRGQFGLSTSTSSIQFNAINLLVGEGAGSVTVSVTRSGNTSNPATINYATNNGTATSPTDYTNTSGSLQFASGETLKTFVVPIIDDGLVERTETINLVLSSPSAGALEGSPFTSTITILDDDIPLESNVSFTQPKVVVVEGTPTAELAVHRESAGAGFTTELTVSYTTAPGTALVTTDFTAKTGTLTWAGDDSSDKTIAIPIVNNAVSESPKAFKVRISTTSPGAQVTTPEATVTILDDDEAFPRFSAVPDDWTMPAGADGGWHVSNEAGAYEGVYSLRSDEILDGQAAQIETARDLGAGAITFRVKISSEPGFDILRFYVDGVEKGSWSGTSVAGWQLFSTPVTAGSHTLRWSYEKDGSASMGQDAAWIDAVTLP